MKSLIQYLGGLLCILVFGATSAVAQQPVAVNSVFPAVGAPVSGNPFVRLQRPSPQMPLGALGLDKAYSYFEPASPTFLVVGNGQYGSSDFFELGERITLDADSGFVDSVRVLLDSISTDSVHVSLFPDTLYQTGSGFYHLINLFSATAVPYARSAIQSSQVHGPTWVMVHFPHTRVPKNFFVMLTPTDNGAALTNFFYWQTDREPSRTQVTQEFSRSAAIVVNVSAQQSASVLLDGVLTPNGESTPLFFNFYCTVFASSEPNAVRTNLRGDQALNIYPNPANSTCFLKITGAGSAATVTVRDLLGRNQFAVSGMELASGRISIPTARFAAGVYEIELLDGNSRIVKPLVVVR